MEIIKNFGVNPILLLAQIVNFLIVLYILKRLLYKPIFNVLKSRKESIEKGLKQAEEARILLEETTRKEKTILKKAQEEARKLIEETKQQRDQMLHVAEVSTRQQAKQILDEARGQIAFETKQAQKELAGHINSLAVEFLRKSVMELFSKEDQELIIKNAVEKLKKRVD